ncbi:MAG TPA: lysophospholipid acyltransferase family protein [Acidobacteriaceae bacterium]|jgi:1-acyl-sn-glycerol-3-phosphate acyltransferase|nr:lysophospholipid acyltransferase family protein [Acidobacteriaceae bacterium]
MLPALTLLLFYSALTPIAALIGFPWTLITGDVSLLYRMARWIAGTGVRLAGIRTHVTGLENVPPGVPCIFMMNHISNLDPPILLPLIPGRTAILVKSELMKIPLLGTGMRMGNFVPVERDKKRESAMASIQQASKVIASGVHITVFPEGTRSRDGRMLPFKKGPFFLAEQTKAPVIPISIYGTEGMMRKGSLKVIPADAYVHFHPPVRAQDYPTREELMKATRQTIASSLPEWMRS